MTDPKDLEGPDPAGEARAEFEKKILDEAPRLGLDDRFKFACHPGVPCFGNCCGDVNIVLTPYDVLRLKNRLGLTSTELLDRFTILPFTKDQRIPAPLLKMQDNEKKSCHFLGEEGCQVYEDRPWACRMYPVGYAAPGKDNPDEKAFWFLLEEEQCRGFEEDREYSVQEWISDQGMAKYDEMGELYRTLAIDDYLSTGEDLDPKKMQMFFMGTYDLDTFRRFVFGSSFLDRVEVDAAELAAIETDDEALMRFAFRWLEFSLFGKPTMNVKSGR
ncbi:MAG: YkgJ family cysteine cluster protein [Planctomycetota bacterium]